MRFALLVFYAAGTLAVPVPDERMPKAVVSNMDCSPQFQPGRTYEYYGETMNQVEGTSNAKTGLAIESLITFSAGINDCSFLMTLSGTEILSKNMNEAGFKKLGDSDAFAQSLQKNHVLFTMKGKQITSVQSLKGETTEALNIKKGVLSAFQLNEQATLETDINGECETSVTKENGVVIKSKSLTDCSKRARSEIGIQSASIRTDMDLKPLDSKSVCKYYLSEEGEIINAQCEESHLFKPFSAGYKTPSGAMTVVTQRLAMSEVVMKAGNQQEKEHYAESSLVYEHINQDDTKSTPNQQMKPVDDVMSKLISKAQLSASESSAKEFTNLVMLLRKMDDAMMKNIWDKYFDCITSKVCGPEENNMKDLYRQYMLDAIAYCGTPSCVSVVKDVTINGEVSGERANAFLMSIAFVAKTTNGMIRDILDIAQQQPSRQVFLTLGTLISRHCAKSPEACTSGPVVDAEKFLVKTLGKCAGQERHERVEEIIMTLKAIGNAKRPLNARNDLIKCAVQTTHTNISMSAFDAIKSMPCDDGTLKNLNQILADKSINEEKRVYAFQAVMNCPTVSNLEQVVAIYNSLDAAQSQLASFMWSKLTNIMESTFPQDKEAKQILAAITAKTPLNVNDLPAYTHSQNMEKSLYMDYLKSGVSAKANLVFNPESIVPKSASLDMTAKIMGVPVDLVETVVGIDGVESLVDNIVLPEVFAFDIFKTNLAEKWQELQQKKNAERKQRKANIEVAKPKQFSGFMSMKIMGQELRVMSYDDIYAMIEEIDNMNVIQLLSKIAKGGEKTFTKSMMFLEMTYTVPTAVGLPLKLKLTGTTVGSMEMKGKLDMRNMFWGPGALTVDGLIKPTAVVEITGKMGVESAFVATGLMVSSNMMVSNLVKGSIEYKAGKILKVNVDTPSEPVQLFKSSSTPYMFMNEVASPIERLGRSIKTDRCMKSQIIGYGLCTSLNVPVAFRDYEAPYYPLSGPSHFGISLVRGDDKLTTFQFLVNMNKQANGLDGVIEFSAPGATYERKMNGKISYSDVNSKKVLTLTTEPFGKVSSVEFTYDGVSRSASIQARNNFFTTKDVVATLSIKNQTNAISTQYGILASLHNDEYKLEHMIKYIKIATGHKVVSSTTYAPGKIVSGSLEYNRVDKKLTATAEASQFNQAVEVSAQVGSTTDGEGLIITATHVPTKKSVVVFSGMKNEPEKKEFTVSFKIGNKTVKNTAGWYKEGGIYTVKDVFSYDKKMAVVAAIVENKAGEKAIKFNADIFGKRASSSVVYSAEGSSKTINVAVAALGKSANLNGKLLNTENLKSMVVTADVMGKQVKSALVYSSVNTTKTIRASMGESLIEAILDNQAAIKTLTFNANILEKEAKSVAQYTTEDNNARQTLKFFADIMGKEASVVYVLTNVHDQKSLKMTVEAIGKKAEGVVGYYRENNAIIFKADGTVAGKSGNVFWRIEKADGYKSIVGFVADKYVGGLRSSVTKQPTNIGACASVYYGLTTEQKTAVASCVEFSNLSNKNLTHLQGKFGVESPVLKKSVELVSDITKTAGRVNTVSKALYNGNAVSKFEFDVAFADPLNAALTVSAVVGKYDISVKTLTQTVNSQTSVRVEMSSMGKTLEFAHKYEKSGELMKLTSNIVLNGKVLPASTVLALQNGKGVAVTSVSVILGSYAAVYKSNINYSGKYGMSSELLAMKNEKIITRVYHKLFATINEVEKAIDHKFGVVAAEKLYEYGWSLAYSKQQLVAKIQYSTKRSSALTVSFNNGAKMAKVNVVFEYIPTKKVSHSISLNKESKQVDVSIEFLPKMFTKFMARLNTTNGYKLITSTHLQWKNFETSMSATYSFVNTNEALELSAKVNENTYMTVKYYKGLPKAITIEVSVAGKSAVLAVSYVKAVVTVQLDVNGKTMFKVQGDYNKIMKMLIAKRDQLVVYLKNGYEKVLEDLKALSEKILKESQVYGEKFLKDMKIFNEKIMKEMKTVNDKIVKEWKLISEKLMKDLKVAIEKVMVELKDVREKAMKELSGLMSKLKSASAEIKQVIQKVQDFIERMKKWISIKIKTKGSVTTFNLKMFGKRYKKLIFNKKKRTLNIQYKNKAAITVTHIPKENIIKVTYKGAKARNTLVLRADWAEKILSATWKVNKVNTAGIKFYVDKLGLNLKLIATPDLIFNTIFSKTDNSLKMEVNRILNKNIINEITAEYLLSAKSSNFVFNYNNETVSKVVEQLKGLGEPLVIKFRQLLHKVLDGYTASYAKVQELTIEAKAEILKFLNKMDKSFDDIDFLAMSQKLTTMAMDAMKKTSTCTNNALNKLATIIDALKERLPQQVEKIRELIKKIQPKIMAAINKINPDIVIAKAKQVLAQSKQLLAKLDAIKLDAKLEEVKVVINKVIVALTKAVKEFAETNAPIIKKAVSLLKDFKIKGKRVEDIVKDASVDAQEIVKTYSEKVNMAILKLKVELVKASKDLKNYILNLEVPKTKKTVAQIIELIQAKLIELKEKVKSLDAKKMIDELKSEILAYKIKGKTIPEHIVELKKMIAELKVKVIAIAEKYRDMPEQARKEFKKLVKASRKYVKDLEVYAKIVSVKAEQVAEFAKPLTNYLSIVKASVTKHYGPIYAEIHEVIVKELEKIHLISTIKSIVDEKLAKLTDMTTRIVEPLKPVFRQIIAQIKSMKGMDIQKFEKIVEELAREAKMELKKEIEKMTELVEKVKSYNTAEMVEKIVKQVVKYLKAVYNEKRLITAQYLKDVEEVYGKVKVQLMKLKNTPLTAVVDELVESALKKTAKSAAKVSGLIKKVVEFDVAKELDVIGRLNMINKNVEIAVNFAKQANLTQLVLDIIAKFEKYVIATSHEAITIVLKDYKIVSEKLNKVIVAVKSISKKDYESWIAEMKGLTKKTEKKIVQWVKAQYERSESRVTETLEKLQKLATADLKIAKSYITALQGKYNLLVSKAELVYVDCKQPTIDVYTHYATIVNKNLDDIIKTVKAIFENAKAKITTELKAYYKELKQLIARLPELKAKIAAQVEKLTVKVDALVAKYGNMTWEEVAMATEKLILKEFNNLKSIVASKEELVVLKIAELKQKVIELYNKAVQEFKRIEAIVKSEITKVKGDFEAKMTQIKKELITKYKEVAPKIVDTLAKYEMMIRAEIKKLVTKIEGVVKTTKEKVTEIYNQNKDKTLKQIYLEIRKFLIQTALVQKQIVGDMVFKNVINANDKLNTVYRQIEATLNAVVLPEIKQELESIFNQTLRNTVTMVKEITKAYKPYAAATKKVIAKLTAAIKQEIPAFIAEAKKLAEINLPKLKEATKSLVTKLETKITELKEVIRKDKTYEKLVAVVEEKIEILKQNPRFITIKKEVVELIAKLEKVIKEKIAEFKQNPTVVHMEAKLAESKKVFEEKFNTKIVELKKFIKDNVDVKIAQAKQVITAKIEELKKYIQAKLEELKKNPTYLKVKAELLVKLDDLKKMTKLVQEKVEKFQNSKEVAQVMATLRQLQSSGQFTTQKLQEVFTPIVVAAIESSKIDMGAVQQWTADFMEAPEEKFWTTYAVNKEAVIDAYVTLISTSMRDIVDKVEAIVAFSLNVYETCTDEWTKKTIGNVGKEIRTFVIKMVAEWQRLKNDLPVLAKKYYNDALVTLKAFADRLVLKTNELAKKQIEMLTKSWETSPLKAFIETGIFSEIMTEIKDHELFALAMEAKDASVKQMMVLKSALIKIYNEQKPILEKTLADLKIKFVANYGDLKIKMTNLYNKIDALVAKTIKMIEETKISDIVAFVQNKYVEIIKKFQTLKVQITEKARILLGQYEKKMQEIVGKVSAKLAIYKEKMMKTYKKLAQQLQETYDKYRPIVEGQYKKIIAKLTTQIERLTSKAAELTGKAKELIVKYRQMIIAQYEKLLKQWNESVVRAKIIAFSKMTIRETFNKVAEVPTHIKKFISAEYVKIAAKITEVLNNVRKTAAEKIKIVSEIIKAEIEQISKQLKPYIANAEYAYKMVDDEIKATVEFVYKYYHLEAKYEIVREFVNAQMAEIKQQVTVIVAKYKKMMTAIPEQIRNTVEGYKALVKKIAEQTKSDLIKKVAHCIGKCTERVEAFVKEAIKTSKVSGDKTLRAIHAAIKKLGGMELKPILEKIVADIKSQITITRKDGTLVFAFAHPEIIPSFSVQLKNMEELPSKIQAALIVKGKELYEQSTVKIAELKKTLVVKIEELKVIIQKYAKIIKENAPIVAEQIKAEMKRLVELAKAKMAELVVKAKQVIKKVKTELVKSRQLLEELVQKLEKKLVELKETIETNPKFNKFVAAVEAKIREIKKVLNEKIAEGKAVAIKTMKQLESKIEILRVTIKKQVEVMKTKATAKFNEIKVIVTEYIKIIKKRAGVIVGEAKLIVKKYVKIIKQKSQAVAAKVKVETEKVRQMMKEMAAKIEMKLKELKSTITKDQRYIKLAAFVEKMLKELKKIMNESIAQGKLVGQKAIVRGRELMTKIEAKLATLKKDIMARVQIVKDQAPIMIAKVKASIKQMIADLEIKLKELKKTITTDKRFVEFVAFVEKKIAQLKEFINTKIAELKKNPTLLKIKQQIEAAKAKYEQLKKDVPVMVAKIEKEIKATLTKSKEFIKAQIPKIQKKIQELMQKIKSNPKFALLQKKVAQLMKIIKAQIAELKKRAMPVIMKMKTKGTEMIESAKACVQKIKENTAELRKDLMTSYLANKNITMYLYNNAKTAANKYYKQGLHMCTTLANKYNVALRETRVQIIKLYNELAKTSLKQVCKDAVAYGKVMYANLKQQCIAKYSETEKLIKESIVVLKQKGLKIESELKNYLKALRNAYVQIKSGAPVKEVLKSLFTELFGKIDIKSYNIKSVICKKDPALCKLVRESWKLHKTLLKKYARKN